MKSPGKQMQAVYSIDESSAGFFGGVEAPGHTWVVVALSAMNDEVKRRFSNFFSDGTRN